MQTPNYFAFLDYLMFTIIRFLNKKQNQNATLSVFSIRTNNDKLLSMFQI